MELLQQTHMEYVVDSSPCRKLQPISHITNLLRDLERPEEARTQLASTLNVQRCHRPVQEL
jgi:hypothetical protein